jgi:hypothetical protein
MAEGNKREKMGGGSLVHRTVAKRKGKKKRTHKKKYPFIN